MTNPHASKLPLPPNLRKLPVMWMRGGTSKGAYILATDLPDNSQARDQMLLRLMGSPDAAQIDGIGGGSPLTSKVALVSASTRPDADVDYLFLQVMVDQPIVTDAQNCGNILAGVGPFALERGLVLASGEETSIRVHMRNTGQIAKCLVQTPGGQPAYDGDTEIQGVPGGGAPIRLLFRDLAGSKCGALLPTGNLLDQVEGLDVTMMDNGMPCVMLAARDLGCAGDETPQALEADAALRQRVEALRLACGRLMNLGDVTHLSVPKMMLLSASKNGGAINTRTFIPHRCHKSIGVFQAVTVATASVMAGTTAYGLATNAGEQSTPCDQILVEHPSGLTSAAVVLDAKQRPIEAGIVRTARKLMDGTAFL